MDGLGVGSRPDWTSDIYWCMANENMTTPVFKGSKLLFTVQDDNKTVIVEKEHQIEILIEVRDSQQISVEPDEDGSYKVKRTVTRFVPAQVTEEMNFTVYEGKDIMEFVDWLRKLTDDELEAARQIYYDRWNCQSGNELHKSYYEAADRENKKRTKITP